MSAKENKFKIVFEFSFLLLFISCIGCLFVAMAIMLGKYELITLVFVILLGALLRPFVSEHSFEKWEEVPVIGEATEIYNDLQSYYLKNRPQYFLYYLFYPISGTIRFLFAPQEARKELNAYFSLIKWVILLLIIEGFASYFRIYQYFEWEFALQWFYLELLLIYFLCNFFTVPVATVSLNLSLANKRRRLIFITSFSLVILVFFSYFFMVFAKYDNLIPVNIIMDKRIANTKAQGKQKDSYVEDIWKSTDMFLKYRFEEIVKFNKQHFFELNEKNRNTFLQNLNEDYQKHLQGISPFGEEEYFYITVTQDFKDIWGLVILPFRDSVFYVFRYSNKKLQIFSKWQEIPQDMREKLKDKWPAAYESSWVKQFARVPVDQMRKLMKKTKSKKKADAGKQALNVQEMQKTTQLMPEGESKDKKEKNLLFTPEQEYKRLQQQYQVNYNFIRWQALLKKLEKLLETPLTDPKSDPFSLLIKAWNPNWQIGSGDFVKLIGNFKLSQEQRLRLEEEIDAILKKSATVKIDQEWVKIRQPLAALVAKYAKLFPQYQQIAGNLHLFHMRFDEVWSKIKTKHSYFTVYNPTLRKLDYERAIGSKLIFDHLGASPELRKTQFSVVYDYFFAIMLWIFRLSMPFHILLIIYCRIQLGSPRNLQS